jgi:hypothetical protein
MPSSFYCSRFAFAQIFIFLMSLIACQEAKHPAATSVVDSAARPGTDPRSRLILALNELRREAASKDSQQVAKMFRFPVADSMMPISGDSVFEAEKARNNGKVSEALFLSGYRQFIQKLEFEALGEVYQNLDINKLKLTDSLALDEKKSKKACLRGYLIQIRKDSVVEIQTYQNTNEGYSGVGREDAQCEEYLLTWYFVFDGRRLYMIVHDEAD